MNIEGLKVRVRDWTTQDFLSEGVWSFDVELNSLDPPVGKTFNSQRFTIETLDGKYIGVCSFYNQTLDEVQLGIRISDRAYWNKGYGTEAVGILVHYWQHMMDTPRLWLKVLPMNVRAIKCYEKCGFMQMGKLALDGYDFIMMERRR